MTEGRKILFFTLIVSSAFVYICNVIPQIKTEAITEKTPLGESPEALVKAGKKIFMSDRARCLTCHSLGEDPKARCPNQDGLGERAPERKPGYSAAAYLVESVYNPNAFIVPGYPRNQMTPVNKPPIALDHDEILAVLAFLNSLGGNTDARFIEAVKKAQEPWRRGLLKPEEGAEKFKLPVFRGDAALGRQVFLKQDCLKCHRVGEEGSDTCPDLSSIGATQPPEYLLESIVDPNAVIVRGYKEMIAIMKDTDHPALRGPVVQWIPNETNPRKLLMNVENEEGKREEREVDLSVVEYIGDTVVAVEIDDDFKRYCGKYVKGDEETGVILEILEGGKWVERRFLPETIDFVNFPMSPMPSDWRKFLKPHEVYDLVEYLRNRKG